MKNRIDLFKKIKKFKDEIPVIILLGGPGSGKGTQALFIKEKYNFFHLSPGDLFREEMKKDTRLGRILKKNYEKGIPQPNDLVNRLVYKKLKEKLKIKRPIGIIFDMYPFNKIQAQALEGLREEFHFKPPLIFWIEIKENEIFKRLSKRLICIKCKRNFKSDEIGNKKICPYCNHRLTRRKDDSSRVIKKRIGLYYKVKKELKEFYENYPFLFDIDGSPQPSIVFRNIDKIIRKFIE